MAKRKMILVFDSEKHDFLKLIKEIEEDMKALNQKATQLIERLENGVKKEGEEE